MNTSKFINICLVGGIALSMIGGPPAAELLLEKEGHSETLPPGSHDHPIKNTIHLQY
jgi:hypothetical protein